MFGNQLREPILGTPRPVFPRRVRGDSWLISIELFGVKSNSGRIGRHPQGKNDMVTCGMKPIVRLAMFSVIAGLLTNATPLMAADPGSTRAAAPQAESKQNPSGDDLRICFRPWRGQQLVQL